MKTVFSNNSELAHKWAHHNGFFRTGNRNLFSENESIFSYGGHFKIAMKIEKPKKETVILYNCQTYSSSTSKHQRAVLYAVNHLTIFTVPNVNNYPTSHRENIQYYFDTIQERLKKASTARSNKPYLINSANHLLIELKLYIKTFKRGLNLRFNKAQKEVLKVDDFCNEIETLETLKIAAKLKQKADLIAYKKRNELAIKKAKIDIEKWVSGEINYLPYSRFSDQKIRLRFNAKNQTIETSQNASVNYNEAKKLYSLLAKKANVIGYNIDGFKVLSVNGTIKIGCHNIKMTEVFRLAESLNW